MCKCKNIELGSRECYSQMKTVKIPSHMISYKKARLKNGLSNFICIDPCIFNEIKHLWKLGIITYGSCCGHNKLESFVNVDKNNIQQMLNLGYVQNHKNKERKDTFKLKSV